MAAAVPKNIFMFWHSDTIPEKIRTYYDEIKSQHQDYNIKLYTEREVINEFPELGQPLRLLSPNHKSDMVRLYLIYRFGGVWCDITTIYLEKLHDIFDLTYTGVQGLSVPFPLNNMELIESGYIVAPKRDPLIKRWFNEFLFASNITFGRYKELFISEFPHETTLCNWLPYLTVHACLYMILKKEPNIHDLKILPCYHLQLHIDNKWEEEAIKKNIINLDQAKTGYKLIKVRSCDR